MFTLNFQERYPVEDIEDLKNEISGLESFWAKKPYGNIMIKTASAKRMVHLEQRLKHGDHLKQLVNELKTKMAEPSRGGAQFDKSTN